MAGRSERSDFESYRDMDDQIRNAQLLLSYASESGINLPLETIESIVRMKHYRDGVQPPPDLVELESHFLQATEMLAKAVSPVTVASLRASYDKQDDTSLAGRFNTYILRTPKPVSLASLSVRHFRLWALSKRISLFTESAIFFA